MQLPIVIIFYGNKERKPFPKWLLRLGFEGYKTHENVWDWGKVTMTQTGNSYSLDYSKVKCEVYVSHWILSLRYLPYRFANWLWRERLADKYQAGYAAGMKEALTNPAAAQAFASLNPAERAALLDLET